MLDRGDEYTFVSAGEARKVLGVDRRHFSKVELNVLALVRDKQVQRYSLQYIKALQQSRAVSDAAAFAGGVVARRVALGVSFYMQRQLMGSVEKAKDGSLFVPVHALARVAGVEASTVCGWYKSNQDDSCSDRPPGLIPAHSVCRRFELKDPTSGPNYPYLPVMFVRM